MRSILVCVAVLLLAASVSAADAVQSVRLEKEDPTLHCLGFRWLVSGDDNANAGVEVCFRKAGATEWRKALPLRRVESAALEDRAPPAGQTIFAGSILFLEPDTEYEMKLELKDPDGGGTVEQFKQRTWAEPVAPAPKRTLHVAPGTGGGSGTKNDPFKGLAAASGAAQAGDLFLLHAGTYAESLRIAKNGTAEAPIVWRGAGDGAAVIEDKGFCIKAGRAQHVFFENLTLRGASYGIHMPGAQHVVVRRCHFDQIGVGVFGDAGEHRLFIADNLIEGVEPWPKPKGHKSAMEHRGVELSGTGSVVCYNTVHNFRDGIDVRSPWPIRGIDIHNNDISECTDDGGELDYSEHNTRFFLNRISNVTCGISFQPIRGGPAYAVRNLLVNVAHETFKLHLTPVGAPHRTSGGVMIHNTVVKSGPPFRVWSDEGPAHHYFLRNNLLVGTGGGALEITCPMQFADFDHNAYVSGGEAFSYFAAWNKKRYATLAEFTKATQLEQHGLVLTSLADVFAAKVELPNKEARTPKEALDLRLKAGSPVIDKGQPLPSINDGFAGAAPDLGAFEFGAPLPQYGVRPAAAK